MSLSPIASRFVAEMGAAHLLVAVDAGSRALPAFAHLPEARLDDAASFDPDWVLVRELPADGGPANELPSGSGVEWIEFAPHDLEDVFALCRSVGSRLVGTAAATLFERRIGRPLATIGGAVPATGRPRVVAVVDLEPLQWAGGHSFETDLIEIAGGTSVTHGGDDNRIEPTAASWSAAAPDLVLVMTKAELDAAEREAALAAVPGRYRVAFFAFDRDFFWLDEPARDAERLRPLIASAVPDRSPLYSDAADDDRGLAEPTP